jgi:hypothetical protein
LEQSRNEEPAKKIQQMQTVHLHVLHFLFSSRKRSRKPSNGAGTMAERKTHSEKETTRATSLDA